MPWLERFMASREESSLSIALIVAARGCLRAVELGSFDIKNGVHQLLPRPLSHRYTVPRLRLALASLGTYQAMIRILKGHGDMTYALSHYAVWGALVLTIWRRVRVRDMGRHRDNGRLVWGRASGSGQWPLACRSRISCPTGRFYFKD